MNPGPPLRRTTWLQRRTRLGVRRDRPLLAARKLPAASLLYGLRAPKLPATPGMLASRAALDRMQATRKRARTAARWRKQYGSRAYMAALHRCSCACAGIPAAGPCGGPIEAAHLEPRSRAGYLTRDGRPNLAALCRTHHRRQEKRADAFIAETGVPLWAKAFLFWLSHRRLLVIA